MTTWEKLKAFFSGSKLDREFDQELASHLDLAIDDGLRRGLGPEEARRQALRRLGGLQQTRELHRESRGLPFLETVVLDLGYALRTLRRTPVFTIVIIVSLALGIGGNTAVFTLINAALLRTLPVAGPDELVRVAASPVLSFPMYQDLRARQQVFTDILASTREWQVRVTIPQGTATAAIDNVPTSFVSTNYFDVLGIQPARGRFFAADDDRVPQSAEAAGSVAVISDGFWERQFGRDSDVIGRVLYVNRSACRIVGIAPAGFAGEMVATATDVWVPVISFSPREYLEARGGQFTQSIARLKPGVTIAEARTAMTALYRELRNAETDRGGRSSSSPDSSRVTVVPVSTGLDSGLRVRFAQPLWIVMGMVGAVLLIACANVVNLLLARSTWRAREYSLRLALGCSPRRLVRQLLTESLLLAALGAISGLVFSYWSTQALLAMADAESLDVRPDFTVAAVLVAMTVLTGVGFGVGPALRASRMDAGASLGEQGRGGVGRSTRRRLSQTLVLIQVAISLLLLVGAGLLIRTLQNLRDVDRGFQSDQVLIFDMAHDAINTNPEKLTQIARDVHERVREIPGIRSASLSSILLFSGSDLYVPLSIDGHPASKRGPVMARFNAVSPGYFETVGMTLLEGRGIQDGDTANAPRVAVINQSLARSYFPDGRALGRTIEIAVRSFKSPSVEIVGIVRDAKYNDLRADVKPMFFVPLQQLPRRIRGIEVRTAQPVAAIGAAVRRAVMDVTPDLMIRRVRTLSSQVDSTLAVERMIATLSAAFGAIALLLSSVGLYGVLSYGVAQRTSEIGIRMALGATRARVLALVLRQSLAAVGGGIVLGMMLAFAATRSIARFLYGLTPTDPMTIGAAIALLLVVAAVAAFVPARRASRVDPLVALRYE
jgi:predicted permease